jgi:hypothetical protein
VPKKSIFVLFQKTEILISFLLAGCRLVEDMRPSLCAVENKQIYFADS